MFFADVAHAMGAAGQQAQGGPMGALGSFLPLILMFAIFYFLLIRPQQKKLKNTKPCWMQSREATVFLPLAVSTAE